jgi:uncharacterized protein (DUF58 family)
MGMLPAPRLIVVTALGLVIAVLPLIVDPVVWPAIVATWGALGLAIAIDVATLAIGRAKAGATVPKIALVGDRVEIPVAFVLRGRASLGATVRLEVESPLAPGDDLRVRIPPGDSETIVTCNAPRRGKGALSALWLRIDGPFGLVRRIARQPIDGGTVKIVPNTRRVRELAIEHFGAHPVSGGLRIERRAGDGGEFDAMVGWAQGMDVRHIDWKSSARHMDLRVRRYRLERNQRLIVCVDVGRAMNDPIEGVTRLDHAIHAAMVLSQTALRGGDLVGMHAYGAEPEAWIAPASGIRHAQKINEACALLSPQPVETNHVLGIHSLLTRLSRRSLIVLLTDISDSTTAELMVEHVGHLARRHLVVFVAIDDPVVEEPLHKEPARTQDLAAAVVAGHLRNDRQRALRGLARLGVDVVHGPPGGATLKLLERYVHIKRRGLIG